MDSFHDAIVRQFIIVILAMVAVHALDSFTKIRVEL